MIQTTRCEKQLELLLVPVVKKADRKTPPSNATSKSQRDVSFDESDHSGHSDHSNNSDQDEVSQDEGEGEEENDTNEARAVVDQMSLYKDRRGSMIQTNQQL